MRARFNWSSGASITRLSSGGADPPLRHGCSLRIRRGIAEPNPRCRRRRAESSLSGRTGDTSPVDSATALGDRLTWMTSRAPETSSSPRSPLSPMRCCRGTRSRRPCVRWSRQQSRRWTAATRPGSSWSTVERCARVAHTGDAVVDLDRFQETLAEGPCLDAATSAAEVYVSDLSDDDALPEVRGRRDRRRHPHRARVPAQLRRHARSAQPVCAAPERVRRHRSCEGDDPRCARRRRDRGPPRVEPTFSLRTSTCRPPWSPAS